MSRLAQEERSELARMRKAAARDDRELRQVLGRNPVLVVPRLRGPVRPLLVEIKNEGVLAAMLGWIAKDRKDGMAVVDPSPTTHARSMVEPDLLANDTRASVVGWISRDRQNDPATPGRESALEILATPDASPPTGHIEQDEQTRMHVGPRLSLVGSGAARQVEKTLEIPGACGVSFLPVKDALDYARKAAAGAQMAVFWQNPATEVCQVTVVSPSLTSAIRSSVAQCDIASPHGEGFLVASYENGKLGPSDGPAMRFADAMGVESAPPVFCLDGARVPVEEHALGSRTALPGFGDAILAMAAGKSANAAGLPRGKMVCALDALDDSFAHAEEKLRTWINAHEPNLRKNMHDIGLVAGGGLVQSALARIGDIRQSIGSFIDSGIRTISIDFGQMSSKPDAFLADLAPGLRAANDDPTAIIALGIREEPAHGPALRQSA